MTSRTLLAGVLLCGPLVATASGQVASSAAPAPPPTFTLPYGKVDDTIVPAAADAPAGRIRFRDLGPARRFRPDDDFLAELERKEIRLGRVLRLLPPAPEAGPPRRARAPQLAFFAQPRGRTFVYVSEPGYSARDGELLFQKIVVPDLFTHRQFSLTFREEHVVSSREVEMVRFGLQMRIRDLFRVGSRVASLFVLGGYDVGGGASAYVAISFPPGD